MQDDRSEYLYKKMRSAYDEIIGFIIDTPFKKVVEELYSLPADKRPNFVSEKILNQSYLESRGISVPENLLIQRSSFGDGRPTLFVVKRYLDEGDRDIWENVNITFDLESDGTGQKPPDVSWQKPLPPSVLAATQALRISSERLQAMRLKAGA